MQDAATGLWYDVPDKPREPGNYYEASASCMLVYTLAKGVRKGYLPAAFLNNARNGYQGILKQFVKTENGQDNLHGTVAVSGLGGKPYRDGSFAYYMSEPVVVNDPKGLGAFILAAVEMEQLPTRALGRQKTVLLDCFFNNEWQLDATGTPVRYHYTWNDQSNSGFAMLGAIFNRYGLQTGHLEAAPTKANLKEAAVYIIVDPDTEKEADKPNYMQPAYAHEIAAWVKAGGVLLLMGNDSGNAELKNFNLLAARFGIRFNEDQFNGVQNNQFEQGLVSVPANHPVFKTASSLFIKELATLQVSAPATVSLTKDGKTIMAMARYGKGVVWAVGDPWLYNEYVDGRKLPPTFDNYKAAEDLARWIVNRIKN